MTAFPSARLIEWCRLAYYIRKFYDLRSEKRFHGRETLQRHKKFGFANWSSAERALANIHYSGKYLVVWHNGKSHSF